MSRSNQKANPRPSDPRHRLSATGTNSNCRSAVVETLEHCRFIEFCDACRRYRYIGLCYGPPGVGKTLSARTYSRWDKLRQSDRWTSGPTENPLLDAVFYTPGVVNAPGNIASDPRADGANSRSERAAQNHKGGGRNGSGDLGDRRGVTLITLHLATDRG